MYNGFRAFSVPLQLKVNEYETDEQLYSFRHLAPLRIVRREADRNDRHDGTGWKCNLIALTLFAEKNNVQLADMLSSWLKEKGWDKLNIA